MSSTSPSEMLDRDELLSSIVESALRAAADDSVTAVLRGYDYFAPGDTAQVLLPFLSVSVSDAEELTHDGGLWSATVTVTACAHWAEDVRSTLSALRDGVRRVMHALQGTAFLGMSIDGVREQSCRTPDFAQTTGDVTLTQVLVYRVWFEYPPVPSAVLDQEPYLVDVQPDAIYMTRSAQDPRRIERFRRSPYVAEAAFGAWADRATLVYRAPLPPLSTASSLNLHQPPADASASGQNEAETP